MELKELTISLCSLMTVSGNEYRSYEALKRLVGAYFDEIQTDNVGNILLIRRANNKNADTRAAKILIDTHFDEIGMLVSAVTPEGFLRVTSVGGLDEGVLQASDVVVYGKETLRGIIASTPPHLRSGDGKKLTPVNEILIDMGYSKADRDELAELVPIGTPVGFAPRYTELLGGNMCGKSFDNKACAAAAIYALANTERSELVADVYLLLSCHEETVRIGGVAVGAFNIEPDYAMVIDVNLAAVPEAPKYETVGYGDGVSVAISAITDRKLTNAVMSLCKEKKIKFTRVAAPSSTGTNTPALNLVGRGVPTADIGLPLKAMHTYGEILNLGDLEELSRLVGEFVRSNEIKEEFAI